MNHVRRRVALVFGLAATVALAGCASFDSPGSGRAAEAPAYRVGDRWVYQRAGRLPAADDVGGNAHDQRRGRGRHRRAGHGEGADARPRARRAMVGTRSREGRRPLRERNAALRDAARSLPVSARRGRDVEPVRRQFRRDARRRPGRSTTTSASRGWETVVTPAGTFDAIVMHVVMWLDDETFWRFPTQCNYTVWYAPAVRGVVREIKRAHISGEGRRHGQRRDGSAPRTP